MVSYTTNLTYCRNFVRLYINCMYMNRLYTGLHGPSCENSGTVWRVRLAPVTMSQFCSPVYESTELSLDLFPLFSCVKHVSGRIFYVFCEFPTSGFRCCPLDLRSPMVKLSVLVPGCGPLDARYTMVKLVLPCISSVFSMEGSIISAIAAVIAL